MREKLTAWPLERKGLYAIRGSTFPVRGILRQNGASWDKDRKRWVGDVRAARAVSAELLYRVRVGPHCHEPAQEVWASEKDLMQGWILLGCAMCDRSYRCGDHVPIVEWQPHWAKGVWCPVADFPVARTEVA